METFLFTLLFTPFVLYLSVYSIKDSAVQYKYFMVIIFHTETVYREKNQKSNLDTRRKTSYTAANRFKLINMKGGWVMKNLGGTARLFKALADENRLHILELLQRGERCACVLLENLHLSQPTLPII